MRVLLIDGADMVQAATLLLPADAVAEGLPPQFIKIDDKDYLRVDDPDSGTFLGGYVLVNGEGSESDQPV